MSLHTRPALPTNCYTQRTAAKDGACFVCNRFTPNVLITDHGAPSDWFYVCPEHTSSSTFCTSTASGSADSAATPVKQGGSKDPSIAADATKPSTAKTETEAEVTDGKDSEVVQTPLILPPAKTYYTLNKDFFYLRQRPFIKRWEQEKDKSFAQSFPSVPHGRPK
ncbi:hypothetical protein GGI24_001685 [Coemansia furcata]|nr:hypothetical protein GGI24_001685 [Coemansia furcata]